jgi:hypothetical protein
MRQAAGDSEGCVFTNLSAGAADKTPEGTAMVSLKNRMVLWARRRRCEHDGCNLSLIGDLISGNAELNAAYIAHILAETPGGPRGDPVHSLLLADDIGNLMLLCDPHHRVIDREAVGDHSESVLLAMKARHEARIEAVSDIGAGRAQRE